MKLAEMMDLSGQIAIITGGAGHIGRVISDAFLEVGCSVILVDRDIELLEKYKKDKLSFKNKIYTVVCDFEKEGNEEVVYDFLHQHNFKLDILVNNAAFVGDSNVKGWVDNFEKQSVETWRRALEVNLTSSFILTQKLVELLVHNNNGRVINVSSMYGSLGPYMKMYNDTKMGSPAAYSVSKGGMNQLTRWLSTTLAPNIRVNTISPGGIERGQPEKFKEKYIERVPLGRLGNEQDLIGAVLFLGSDMSKYVTGQDIVVDGGYGII